MLCRDMDRWPHGARMRIIIGLAMFFIGIGVAGGVSITAGIVVGCLGLWILSGATVAEEQNFMGALMLMAGIGATIPFIELLWSWIKKLLP